MTGRAAMTTNENKEFCLICREHLTVGDGALARVAWRGWCVSSFETFKGMGLMDPEIPWFFDFFFFFMEWISKEQFSLCILSERSFQN